jgi:hypothetical protein
VKAWHATRVRHVRYQRISSQDIAALGETVVRMLLDGDFFSVQDHIRETVHTRGGFIVLNSMEQISTLLAPWRLRWHEWVQRSPARLTTQPAPPVLSRQLRGLSHRFCWTTRRIRTDRQIFMGTGVPGTGDSALVAFTKLKQSLADANTNFAKLFLVRSIQAPVTGFAIAAAAGITDLVLNRRHACRRFNHDAAKPGR